jgi:hypothetical protein
MLYIKVLVFDRQQIWHNTNHGVCFILVLLKNFVFFIGVAVHEAASWLEMSVNIAEDVNRAFFLDHRDKLAHNIHRWMKPGRWLNPSAVHIKSSEVGPLVSVNNTIWVEHRHYIKDVLTSKLPCLNAVRKQEVDHAFQGKRALGLS